MLTIGDKFPNFDLKAVVSTEPQGKAFTAINDTSDEGKWKIVFFWPKGLHLVCSDGDRGLRQAETASSNDRDGRGLRRPPTDSEFVHLAWRQKPCRPEATCRSPCWADIQARAFDRAPASLDKQEGVALRRDLHRRSRGRHPLRVGERPQRRPATRRRCCACSTRSRPTSSAPCKLAEGRTTS